MTRSVGMQDNNNPNDDASNHSDEMMEYEIDEANN